MTPHAARREALRIRLADAGLDALLVTTLANVRYLTGFTGSSGTLLVTVDGTRFVTDGRYETQAEVEVPDLERVISRGREWLPDALEGHDRLGVESHRLAWDEARSLSEELDVDVMPAPDHVEVLRSVKDPSEIGAIGRACEIADEAFSELLDELRPGMTEREVALALERGMVTRGAEAAAFPSIVASGPNGARPHHRGGQRVLEHGDVITFDFGARVEGYHSDMSRLVALGEPEGELADVVRLVRRAQRAGLEAVAPGTPAVEVDAACREPITEAGYGEAFVHGTGHGIGLEPHEAPRVAPRTTATLTPGAVITVEPGIYLPGLGGARIEDTVVVESDGARVLTKTTKDLIVV